MQNLDVRIPHRLTATVCLALLTVAFVVGCPETTPDSPTGDGGTETPLPDATDDPADTEPDAPPIEPIAIVEIAGQGSVTQETDGTTITLLAVPIPGWSFLRWIGGVDLDSINDNPVIIPTTATTIFPIRTLALFVRNDDGNGGASVEESQDATWLVIVAIDDMPVFTATAFGVGPDMLATNAHVVEGVVDAFSVPGAVATVIQHETGSTRTVITTWAHPEYDAVAITSTPDVGLLQVDGTLPSFLTLADDSTLRALGVLDEVALCGFPGSVTIVIDLVAILTGDSRPRASCLTGTISALRPFDPRAPSTPENSFLVQYDLPTEPGTSGSAVLDNRGEVIAVNSLVSVSLGDSNFGIRSDKLEELIAWVSQGIVSGTVLADVLPGSDDGSNNDSGSGGGGGGGGGGDVRPVCGDGSLDSGGGEECDDGNTTNGDGCDSNCITETCGNSVVQTGEECDPPAAGICDNNCLLIAGGDNDSCSTPTVVGVGETSFSNVDATSDGPMEGPTCLGFDTDSDFADIWFNHTATCTGFLTVSLCASDPVYDTTLAVYEGFECPSLAPILCSDDDCGFGVASRVSFAVVQGAELMIRIGGFENTLPEFVHRGDGTLNISCGDTPGGTEACGEADAGDCFAVNGSAGCADQACCETVCDDDPFCCEVDWDDFCSGAAGGLCGTGFAACGADAGDCGVEHTAICPDDDPLCNAGCNDVDCCQSVCEQDTFCCLDTWDDVCASAAGSCRR